jgi:secreted PhoX family phosphatase
VGSNDFDEPFGLAIDPSGNIWIADGQSYIITELVGAAAPVVTPLSPKHLGQKP